MKTIRTLAIAVTMGLSIAACATVAGTAVGAGTGALIDIFGR